MKFLPKFNFFKKNYMQILDGKTLSEKIIDNLSLEIRNSKLNINLDIVLVGDDPASLKYVELKNKKAESIGIGGQIYHLSQNSSTDQVIHLINQLNKKKSVTGLMVQLPLPSQIDTTKVLMAIDPKKDADGLSPINLGLLFQKKAQAIPSATSLGIMKLLTEYDIDLDGKNAVIIGRSPDVSLPLFAQLMAKNCTVTICHSYTKDMAKITSTADILISAIGKPGFLGREFVKKGAVIIDVGYAADPLTGKTTGDFDFENIKDKVSYITPVPGGVGPMTIASLLYNTVQLTKNE